MNKFGYEKDRDLRFSPLGRGDKDARNPILHIFVPSLPRVCHTFSKKKRALSSRKNVFLTENFEISVFVFTNFSKTTGIGSE